MSHRNKTVPAGGRGPPSAPEKALATVPTSPFAQLAQFPDFESAAPSDRGLTDPLSRRTLSDLMQDSFGYSLNPSIRQMLMNSTSSSSVSIPAMSQSPAGLR